MDSHLARQVDKMMEQTNKLQQRHLSMQSKLELQLQQQRGYLTLPLQPMHLSNSMEEIPSDLQESGKVEIEHSNIPFIIFSPNEEKTDKSSERSSQFMSPFTPLTPISPISPTFTFPTIPQTAEIFTKHPFKHSFSVWNNSFYNDDKDEFNCTLKRNHGKKISSCKYDHKENQKKSLVEKYNQNCSQQDEISSEKNVLNVEIFEIQDSEKTRTLTKLKPATVFETNDDVETTNSNREKDAEIIKHSNVNEQFTCYSSTTFNNEITGDVTTPMDVTNIIGNINNTLPAATITTNINKPLVKENDEANLTRKNCFESFLHNEGCSNAKFIKEEKKHCHFEDSFLHTRSFETSPIKTNTIKCLNTLKESESLYSSVEKVSEIPLRQQNSWKSAHNTQTTIKGSTPIENHFNIPTTVTSSTQIPISTTVKTIVNSSAEINTTPTTVTQSTTPTYTTTHSPTTTTASNTKVLVPSIQDSASLQAISVSREIINHEFLASNPSRTTKQHLKNSNIIRAISTCTYSSADDRYAADNNNLHLSEAKTLDTTNKSMETLQETTATLQTFSTTAKEFFINNLSAENVETIKNSTVKTENKTKPEKKNIEKATLSKFFTNMFNSKCPDSLEKNTLLSYKNIETTQSSLGSEAVLRRGSQGITSKDTHRVSISRIVDAAEIGRRFNSLKNSLKKKSMYVFNSNEEKSET